MIGNIPILYYILLIMTLVIIYNFYQINRLNKHLNLIEGMTSEEAIKNVAALYNQGDMKITNLEVTGI